MEVLLVNDHGKGDETVSRVATTDEGEIVPMGGKKVFNTFSTLALAVTLMATWEALCATMGTGLVAGGPVSLVYGFIGKHSPPFHFSNKASNYHSCFHRQSLHSGILGRASVYVSILNPHLHGGK